MSTRLSIPINAQQHQLIKLKATLHGQTIKDYVLERLLGDDLPNEKTLKAIEELEADINVKSAKTVDALFNDILNK